MNVVLFDDPTLRTDLLPLTFTRPVAGLRVGILTIAEKWEKYLGVQPSYATEPYLNKKFSLALTSDNLWINGALCPDPPLVKAIENLKKEEGLTKNGKVIALRTAADEIPEVLQGRMQEFPGTVTLVDQLWKIFQFNGSQIRQDYALITRGRKSSGITDRHTRSYGEENIFVEEGAKMKGALLNAENGPIYLGRNSELHEGALIRGPFALCEGSHVNMGAKVRGDTTVGPFSKIGGEVSNTVIFGYSSKAHDGFLGNSVIGEWCNLGADSNTSNLKNNYENIKIWNYGTQGFKDTGLMFCGVMMGDHSKCGINMMFNTGTVIGVAANIFGGGYPRTFIPSFAWGGAAGFSTFLFEKAMQTATRAMERRGLPLTDADREIYAEVFRLTSKFRVWEKK